MIARQFFGTLSFAFTAAALSLTQVGCASVQSVSLTPIPAQRSNVVKAEVSKTIILAFNFDNDYVEPLVSDLKAKCPGGVVSGILTKDEVISYVFWHTRHIVATGFCSKGKVAANNKGRGTASDSATNAVTE